ncbi:2-polyprenyl-6-methoxyphenol hydroxylase [Mucilaginibacter pineti]|uniref:2-polyprenyl-6-methoxyphenol hydroxylase n=1 Tax=Mucilaginibacter pineti TaxID=1391627 RepID=A0A1G7NHV2_9SPHI|nr:FAD-dependent monooxygenase [Mucilaginibacter pineti]SDF73532.1 2-polyprenyl-6-methoxyphenol hydroxylase [Mucilaginibacter pineti]
MVEAQVIVIGAGPTGLMAACQLARFGIKVIVIDKKSGINLQSRALLVTARSLEVYQQMGLSGQVINGGSPVGHISVFFNNQEKIKLKTNLYQDDVSAFPCFHIFEQSRNEELLLAHFEALGGRVMWDTEMQDLVQGATTVTVCAKQLTRDIELVIIGRYLIGCDGARSCARHLLKLAFSGGTYEKMFYVIDAKINTSMPAETVIAAPGKSDFVAFFPMRGSNIYRILGSINHKLSGGDCYDEQELRKWVCRNSPFPIELGEINWSSVYQLHHRSVKSFRVDKCFLAGDAAHIHSPAGGQGMNAGLQDAYNLSWKLAAVLNGYTGPGILESYNHERLPFARWLIKFTDRLFNLMMSSQPVIAFFRSHILPFIITKLAGGRYREKGFYKSLSQIWLHYRKSALSESYTTQPLTFRAGDRCPYVSYTYQERPIDLYSLLTSANFHLVIISDEQEFPAIPERLKPLLKIVNVPLCQDWHRLGVKKKLYLLIRPDNYIAMLSDIFDPEVLKRYFDKF